MESAETPADGPYGTFRGDDRRLRRKLTESRNGMGSSGGSGEIEPREASTGGLSVRGLLAGATACASALIVLSVAVRGGGGSTAVYAAGSGSGGNGGVSGSPSMVTTLQQDTVGAKGIRPAVLERSAVEPPPIELLDSTSSQGLVTLQHKGDTE